MDPARIPVIIGVGQINDRTEDPFAALDPVALMAAALRAADADSGGGWLAAIDSLSVVDQISFPELNPVADALASTLDIAPAHRFQTAMPMGDSPVRLLNEAANRIGAGKSVIAAIVGAEALRTAARRAAATAGGGEADHNALRARYAGRVPGFRQRYGLVSPVDIYPLYENATRSAWGQTLAQAQAETGRIWELFSQTAAGNSHAWLRTARTAEEIVTPSTANRPIAFPYLKLMVANSSVNQGAGFIVTSLARARAQGVADDRVIFIGHGAAAHEPDDVLARDSYASSLGMRVSLEEVLSANALTIEDIDFVELYSCFPCVPKMARRIIGWPEDRPASVTGGLTFGGGPIGNYMSHAIAAMVERLRTGGRHGLLFGNGGFATHNHSIILSREPLAGVQFPQNFDVQPRAEALRGQVPPIDESYEGLGTVETYTVFYDRSGAPTSGVIVARSLEGSRFLARIRGDDGMTIAMLTDGRVDPVGSYGTGIRGDDGLLEWRPGA